MPGAGTPRRCSLVAPAARSRVPFGMGWRETWRATVESFLREVREPALSPGADAVLTAIAAARAELTTIEQELRTVGERLAEADAAAAVCARRQEMATRIGDGDTARLAQRFRERHEAHADVLRRKQQVLRDERALAAAALNELLDYARADATPPGEEPSAAADR